MNMDIEQRRRRAGKQRLRRAVVASALLAMLATADAAGAGRQRDTIWRGPADLEAAATGWLGDGSRYAFPEALVTLVDGVEEDTVRFEVGSSRLSGDRTTTLRVQTASDSLLPGVLPGSTESSVVDATCTATYFWFGDARDRQWFGQSVGTYVVGDARIGCATDRNDGWVVDYPADGEGGSACVTVRRMDGASNGAGTMRFEPLAGCQALVRKYAGKRWVDEGTQQVVPFRLDVVATQTS